MEWIIDTHCHLDLMPDIQNRYSEEDTLPIKTISVTNAPSIFEHNQRLFENTKNIRLALGMHPELVSEFSKELALFKSLLYQTKYVGEIGIDGSDRFKSTFALQVEVFTEIIKSCSDAGNKIITVHTRKAETEVINILKRTLKKNQNCKVIFHWFTGNVEALKNAIMEGFYLSVNHKMLSTQKGRELVKYIPVAKLLTESDAPFTLDRNLSRMGSLNKSIEELSLVLGSSPNEMKQIIYNNFRTLLS